MSDRSTRAGRDRVRYTWDDYRGWDDGARWELLGGEPCAMSPSPGRKHQWVQKRLTALLDQALAASPCEVYPAPFDVKLSEHDVVQPDVLVVCDPELLRDTHVEGAPGLVVEVLSPSSWLRDCKRKLELYARSGVLEYWLVSAEGETVQVLALAAGRYVVHGVYTRGDTVCSATLPLASFPCEEVFDFPFEPPPDLYCHEVHEGGPAYYLTR